MGPFMFAEVPGDLRLEAAGKVLEDEADPVDAAVPPTGGAEGFSKLAVAEGGVISSRAEAAAFAGAEGFGAFLLEPALCSTVPSATKQTGEAVEMRAGPSREGAFSCL